MKMFGVNIIYSAEESIKFREDWKDTLTPKRAKKLRAYEITNESDKFKKWKCSFGLLSTIKLHIQTVFKYWFNDRPKYLRWLNNQC